MPRCVFRVQMRKGGFVKAYMVDDNTYKMSVRVGELEKRMKLIRLQIHGKIMTLKPK